MSISYTAGYYNIFDDNIEIANYSRNFLFNFFNKK